MASIDTLLVARVAKSIWTTTGDILYASGASTPARLGVGSSGQVLTVAGGLPSWVTPAVGTSPPLPFASGSDIVAASTINVDHQVHRVSGATAIQQITALGTVPTGGMVVTLIAVGGAINLNSLANVFATGAGGTRAVPQHAAVTLVYDGTAGQWNVSGVGS